MNKGNIKIFSFALGFLLIFSAFARAQEAAPSPENIETILQKAAEQTVAYQEHLKIWSPEKPKLSNNITKTAT